MLDSVSLATSISWGTGGQGLLSLSCHGISNDFQSKQFHLKCEALDGRHTDDVACRIRVTIANVCQELQLPKEKINCIIRDEGTCIQGAIIECNVHLLKICVKYALESNEHLKQLDAKCLQISKHFQQSHIAYNHLKYIHEKQLNREPLQLMEHNDNHLDWSAIFRLKGRLLKLKDALSIYAEEYNMVKIYPDEWLDIDLGQRVIQPIEEIVNIWSGTSATASSVIPLIAALRDSLRTDVHNFVSSVVNRNFREAWKIDSISKSLTDHLLVCSKVARGARVEMLDNYVGYKVSDGHIFRSALQAGFFYPSGSTAGN